MTTDPHVIPAKLSQAREEEEQAERRVRVVTSEWVWNPRLKGESWGGGDK